MSETAIKTERRRRRKRRVRGRIFGTPECPRLTVFRSLKHIYAQVIDDQAGTTLVSAGSTDKDFRARSPHGGNRAMAAAIGKILGEKARAKGIERVAFDRNGYRYHGRIKALADAAREAGLKF